MNLYVLICTINFMNNRIWLVNFWFNFTMQPLLSFYWSHSLDRRR